MIVIKREVLDNYLKAINKSHAWLSHRLGFTKGYWSQIINNRCKISAIAVERLLCVTQIDFQDLFHVDGRPDLREFYGDVFSIDGQPISKIAYNKFLRDAINSDNLQLR